MFTAAFWAATGERALKTFAQSLLAALTMTSAPIDVLHTSWTGTLSLALGATVLSVCTSLSSVSVGLDATPGALAAAGRHRELLP